MTVGGMAPNPQRPGPGALTGRTDEHAVVTNALSRAQAGEPSLVIVEGAAGVGKSALVQQLIATRDRTVRLLFASGEEAEQRLDLGIVEQLFQEAAVSGLEVPMPFGRSGARPDPLQVGDALLGLVGAAAAEGPVLMVIDDAQWSDQPSLQALTFALRRIRRLSVLSVVIQRPDVAGLEPLHRLVVDGHGSRLRLGGLGVHDLRELIVRRTGVVLTVRAGERLHAHTRGNPLETIAVADELDPGELASGIGPLPAPRSYATVMLNRLAGGSADVERLVSAVAVIGNPVPVGLLAEMLEITDGSGAMDAAIEDAVLRGLLQVDLRAGLSVLDVAHPLLRSAIVYDLAPGRRAELHRGAALITSDPTRRMLHRLTATIGEDASLGREAVDLARDRLRHGWELSAVDLLTTATSRFPEGPERDDAVLLAVDTLVTIGEVSTARELLSGVDAHAERAREQLLRGQLAFLEGDRRAAGAALLGAWEAGPEPDVASRTAMLLATIASNTARADESLAWSRLALERGDHERGDVGHALTMVASAWALKGDLTAGRDEVQAWLAHLGAPSDAHDILLPHGLLLLWDGALDEAREALEAALPSGGEQGSPLVVASIRYALADALYRIGHWDRSLDLADQLAATLDDADIHLAAPMAHAVAAFVLAGRGETARVDRHLTLGTEAAEASGNPSGLLWLTVAAARAAEARGDAEGVVAQLQPLAELTVDLPLPEGVQPWRADLVHALVSLDRLDEAEAALAMLDARLVGGGAHARTGAGRARGLLAAARGQELAAADAFSAALAEDPMAAGGFARARLELVAGGFDRRRGHRREAAARLGSALDRFTAMGAAPYQARARQELDACGLAPRARTADPVALTPAEATVARLVALGRTNREVAGELVVSVKTVETHLGRVFAKLGVRSRTELASRWMVEPEPAPHLPTTDP